MDTSLEKIWGGIFNEKQHLFICQGGIQGVGQWNMGSLVMGDGTDAGTGIGILYAYISTIRTFVNHSSLKNLTKKHYRLDNIFIGSYKYKT